MSAFLLVVGFLGLIVSLVLLVFGLIKRNGKVKRNLILIVVCFIMWGVGAETDTSTETAEPATTDVKQEEPAKKEKSVEEKAKEEAEAEAEAEAKAEEEAKAKAEEEARKKAEEEAAAKAAAEAAKPKLTLSQENALRAAKSYLDYTAFSRQGLIKQLEYEGYSNQDATFAVDNITVDWNEQAVLSGKNYLDYTAFSRSGLIDQLVYEGFSTEQATYAVDQIGL
jgi:colicin import membrane protein